MIFFGQKAKMLVAEFVPAYKCTHCGNSNTTNIAVAGKYFHVYWIPFFPTAKMSVSSCEHCKQSMAEKDMPAQLQMQAADLRNRTKSPVWFFSGLGVVAALIALVSVTGSRDDANDLKMLDAPAAGHKYHVKMDASEYSIWKVNKVEDDSVFFIMNEYLVDKSTGLHRIDKDENYKDGFEQSIHKDRLKELYKERTIIEVDR